MFKMRFFLRLSFFLLIAQGAFAQGPINWLHVNDRPTSSWDLDYKEVVRVPGNGYIIGGHEDDEALVVKLDDYGQVEWERDFPFFGDFPFHPSTNVPNWVDKIIPTQDGGYLVGVHQASTTNPTWLLKLGASGNIIDFQLKDTITGSASWGVDEFDDGRLLLDKGYRISPTRRVPIIEIQTAGGIVISRDTIFNSNYWLLHTIHALGDEELYLWGQDSLHNVFVQKLDTAGNVSWTQTTYNNPSEYDIFPIEGIVLPDSNFLTFFSQDENNNLNNQKTYHAVSMDPNGNTNWHIQMPDTFGVTGNFNFDGSQCEAIVRTDGNILVRIRKAPVDYLFCIRADGVPMWSTTISNPSSATSSFFHDICPGPNNGIVMVGDYTALPPQKVYAALVDTAGVFRMARVEGRVFRDDNQDCQQQGGELGSRDAWVTDSTGIYAALTDTLGDYYLNLPLGTHKLTVTPLANLYGPMYDVICPANDTQVVNVTGAVPIDTIPGVDFSLFPNVTCPLLVVDLTTPFVRNCDTSTHFVDYCNYGTADADSAYVIVTIDTGYAWNSANPIGTNVGPQQYRFDLGTVAMGVCSSFTFQLVNPCGISRVGRTYCNEARIYPDSSCFPPDPSWSGASVRVSGDCVGGDSVQFTIENTGDAPMAGPTTVWVVEDDILRSTRQLQLGIGDDSTYTFRGNGSTWTTLVDQEPGHPGLSIPRAFVEGCGVNGSGIQSLGYINNFEDDDRDHYLAIDCHQMVAAYDPNDKQGFPRGHGPVGLIKENTEMEYLIRFQNTGTDTAFKVIIRDRIPETLMLSSLVEGSSSHPYRLLVRPDRVVEWIFDPIVLPDSNVNEPASHGFLKFTIRQQPDLPNGTEIKNAADIYFDFNPPIITDTALHTIGELEFVVVSIDEPVEEMQPQIRYWPNPAIDRINFDLGAWYPFVTVELFDLRGQMVRKMDLRSTSGFTLESAGLGAGMYVFRVRTGDELLGQGKVLVRR